MSSKKLLGYLDKIKSWLEFFYNWGIWGVVIVLLAPLGIGILSFWEKIPLSFKLALILGVFSLTIILLNGISEFRSRKRKKTIILLPKHHANTNYWSIGSHNNKLNRQHMHIIGEFTATNIAKFNIRPVLAKMKKPSALGGILIQEYGQFEIPKRETTTLTYSFFIEPPFKNKGESFKADIAIIDQFGNEHWVNDIEFPYQ